MIAGPWLADNQSRDLNNELWLVVYLFQVHYLDKASDIDTMIWNMANFKHHRISFLRHRPYMVSSEVDFKQTSDDKGTLQVRH